MTTMLATLPLAADLRPGAPPILQVEPPDDALGWVRAHRDLLRATTLEHGALLVRGLGLRDPSMIGAAFRTLAPDLMTEREGFAARTTYADGVYSTTAWPPSQPMCLHHELSYAFATPGLLLFACLLAPEDGGATPVADGTAVLEALPRELVERFEREGWLLTRAYGDGIGATVESAFGTADRAEVERYCRANAIELEWQPDGGLHTRQRRRAIVRHPVTGRRSWFNQVAFLSAWTMDPEVREFLVELHGPDGLPFDTRYGDGEPIGADVIAVINDAYDRHTVREPWQAGDLLLVDNVRTAHGRDPFTGSREVLAALAEPVRVAGGTAEAGGSSR